MMMHGVSTCGSIFARAIACRNNWYQKSGERWAPWMHPDDRAMDWNKHLRRLNMNNSEQVMRAACWCVSVQSLSRGKKQPLSTRSTFRYCTKKRRLIVYASNPSTNTLFTLVHTSLDGTICRAHNNIRMNYSSFSVGFPLLATTAG